MSRLWILLKMRRRTKRTPTRGGTRTRRALVIPDDLPPAMRIALIKKALKDCGQPVTKEAVREQFHRETGEDPEGVEE